MVQDSPRNGAILILFSMNADHRMVIDCANGGFNPLYQIGGPRSIGWRFSFSFEYAGDP